MLCGMDDVEGVREVPGGDVFLSTKELAEYLRLPVATIHAWRHWKKGPPAARIGRHLRFRLADVEAWLAEHTS